MDDENDRGLLPWTLRPGSLAPKVSLEGVCLKHGTRTLRDEVPYESWSWNQVFSRPFAISTQRRTQTMRKRDTSPSAVLIINRSGLRYWFDSSKSAVVAVPGRGCRRNVFRVRDATLHCRGRWRPNKWMATHLIVIACSPSPALSRRLAKRPHAHTGSEALTGTFLSNAEPEQAGVRPGQDAAEEDRSDHRDLHR